MTGMTQTNAAQTGNVLGGAGKNIMMSGKPFGKSTMGGFNSSHMGRTIGSI